MEISDLIAGVAQAAGLSYEKAKDVVETVLDSLSKALEQGEAVDIPGFENFQMES